MTPADIRKEYLLPLFQAGAFTFAKSNALDAKISNDIAVRAAANRAYKPAKVPVAEWADAWMAKHPAVYPLFVKFALEIASKRTRFSAKAIVERLRWETAVQGGADFKIANAVTAYLARRFVRDFPEHSSLFLMAKRGGAV